MVKQNVEELKERLSEVLGLGEDSNFEILARMGLMGEKVADEADDVTKDRFQMINFRLRNRQKKFQKSVQKALTKLEEGTYGECEDCGADISTNRLKARPTATLCITCKDEQERNELGRFDEKKRTSSVYAVKSARVLNFPGESREQALDISRQIIEATP